MKPKFDVLGLGVVAVDELLYVDSYPSPDEKAEVLHRERQCGGIAATGLIAAARLGASCAYAGVLGRDELSSWAAASMRDEGINLKHIARREGVRPVHSVIIIDKNHGTRNIFFDTAHVVGAAQDWPPPEVIQSTRVLMLDWYRVRGMIRAGHLARQAGIPVVGDFEQDNDPSFPTLLGLPDHLILSRSFAAKITGQSDPRRALRKLWKKHHRLAAITCGAEGCWYLTAEDPARLMHQKSFPVKVIDTTGCGDVFHGIYAEGLARGLGAAERIRRASAAAALKARGAIPTLAKLETFLNAD